MTSTSPKAPIADSDLDDGETRRLNDELRKFGRGGVVTVSLSLVAAGLPVVEKCLRAVAMANADGAGWNGTVLSEGLQLEWRICVTTGLAGSDRILCIMLSTESAVAGMRQD